MPNRMRSPFGTLLREERKAQGISQAELARRIQERFENDPSVAEYGVVSDRAIANIEAAKASADEFVRPRPETVHVLLLALDIDEDSSRGQALLNATSMSHRRESALNLPTTARYGTAFIEQGREPYLKALRDAWMQALSGKPQVLLVAGAAGVGKSRLINGFTDKIASEGFDFTLAMGECSIGAATSDPYLPWRRAMNNALRLNISDNPRTDRSHNIGKILVQGVGRIGNSIIDPRHLQSWVASRAPELLPEAERLSTMWSATDTIGRHDEYADVLGQICRQRPLILVLEDLHWADERSCNLLLHVHQRLHDQSGTPLLIIGSYRPADLFTTSDRHPLSNVINELLRYGDSDLINMNAAQNSSEALAFVSGLVQTLNMSESDHKALVGILENRTHGHPLYVTEYLKRLVETGALREEEESTWVLDEARISSELPSRMRAIIDERIHRLSETGRTIVEAASVQGSPFDPEIIPFVTGFSEAEVAMTVDRELLEQHKIFQVSSDSDGSALEFDHDVMMEIVYSSLSPQRRKALHRRTADAILSGKPGYAEQIAARAAHHYEQAGLFTEATEQALSACYESLARLDHDLAAVWIDRTEQLAAIANVAQLYWRARICKAHYYRNTAQLDEALALGQSVLAQSYRFGDQELEGSAHEVIASVAYDRSELQEAIDHWTMSSQIFEQFGLMERVSSNRAMISHISCRMGRQDQAIRWAHAAWSAAPAQNNSGLRAESLLAEGNALIELGRYKDAHDLFVNAQSYYSQLGEMRGILLCRMNIGLCLVLMGKPQQALEQLEALQITLDTSNTPRLRAFAWFYHGRAYEAAGNARQAAVMYRRGLDTRVRSGMGAMAGDDLAGILRAQMDLGQDVESSLRDLEEWWAANDYEVLEDPLAAMLTIICAYEYLGQHEKVSNILQTGINLFMTRAEQIENPSIRDQYLRGNWAGQELLKKKKEAGFVDDRARTS